MQEPTDLPCSGAVVVVIRDAGVEGSGSKSQQVNAIRSTEDVLEQLQSLPIQGRGSHGETPGDERSRMSRGKGREAEAGARGKRREGGERRTPDHQHMSRKHELLSCSDGAAAARLPGSGLWTLISRAKPQCFEGHSHPDPREVLSGWTAKSIEHYSRRSCESEARETRRSEEGVTDKCI